MSPRGKSPIAAIVVSLTLSPWMSAFALVNTDFNPYWTLGDSWRVRFTVRLLSTQREAGPGTESTEEATYRYTVSSEAVQQGRNVIRIEARSEGNDWPTWLLTFDRDLMVLISTEELVPGGGGNREMNPFGDDAWMLEFYRQSGALIRDFHRI